MPLLNTADALRLGASEVDKVYLGATEVWSAEPPFDPLTDLTWQVYLDPELTSGLTDGNTVAQVDDASGNSRHATQGSAGFRPTYETNELNGHAILRFTGDSMSTPAFTRNQPHTVVAVAKYRGAYSANAGLCDGHTAFSAYLHRSGSTSMQGYAGSGLVVATTPQAYHIYVWVVNGASSRLVIDGTTTSGTSGATNASGMRLGVAGNGGEAGDIDLAFCGCLSGAISTDNQALLFAALGAKYAITVA